MSAFELESQMFNGQAVIDELLQRINANFQVPL
jgi:hypothetical protein